MVNFIKKISECPEQYGKKIIFFVIESNFFKNEILFDILRISLPPNVINVLYTLKNKVNEGRKEKGCSFKIGFEMKSIKEILPIKIKVKIYYNKYIKERRSIYKESALLSQKNIVDKLKNDIHYIFKFKSSLSEKEIEKFYLDSVDENKINALLEYYIKALYLLENIHGNNIKNETNIFNQIKLKLKDLINNIISRNIYDIIINQIENIISEGISELIEKELEAYKIKDLKVFFS